MPFFVCILIKNVQLVEIMDRQVVGGLIALLFLIVQVLVVEDLVHLIEYKGETLLFFFFPRHFTFLNQTFPSSSHFICM